MKNYKLANAITKAGYSFRDFEAETGLPQGTVSHMVAGSLPNVSRALLVANALRVRVEDLWDAEARRPSVS